MKKMNRYSFNIPMGTDLGTYEAENVAEAWVKMCIHYGYDEKAEDFAETYQGEWELVSGVYAEGEEKE